MRKHTLVVGVAAFLLFSGCLGATESINESYTSEYTYTVSVRTNAALENASFLLPAPIYRN